MNHLLQNNTRFPSRLFFVPKKCVKTLRSLTFGKLQRLLLFVLTNVTLGSDFAFADLLLETNKTEVSHQNIVTRILVISRSMNGGFTSPVNSACLSLIKKQEEL